MISSGFDDMARRAKRGMSMDFESLLTLMKQGKEMLEAVIDIEKEMESPKHKRRITMLKKAGK